MMHWSVCTSMQEPGGVRGHSVALIADSTVLVSAFLRKEGVSAVLLRHAAGGAFALSLSQAISPRQKPCC
jgi:hypothetical protein